MKRKDLISLTIALAFLVGVSYYAYQQLGPKKSSASTAVLVEVAPVIPDQLDPNGTLDKLNTSYQVQDYKQGVDLTQGIGNSAPFGQ